MFFVLLLESKEQERGLGTWKNRKHADENNNQTTRNYIINKK